MNEKSGNLGSGVRSMEDLAGNPKGVTVESIPKIDGDTSDIVINFSMLEKKAIVDTIGEINKLQNLLKTSCEEVVKLRGYPNDIKWSISRDLTKLIGKK